MAAAADLAAAGEEPSALGVRALAARLRAAAAARDAGACGGLAAALAALEGEGPESERRRLELRDLGAEDAEAVAADLAELVREVPGADEPEELCLAREASAAALARLPPPAAAAAAVPALAESLLGAAPGPAGEARRRARTAAVFALADLQDRLPEEALEPAAPALASVLAGAAGDGEGARAIAAFALGRLGEPARAFVPLLAQVLDEPMMRLRLSAIGALAGLGPAAFSACGRLEELAADVSAEADVREAAASALESVGSLDA